MEDEAEFAAKLREVVAKEGDGLNITVTDGDVSQHLPGLLKQCEDIPLFVYLDPCGLVIPLDEVASIFDRPSGLRRPRHRGPHQPHRAHPAFRRSPDERQADRGLPEAHGRRLRR